MRRFGFSLLVAWLFLGLAVAGGGRVRAAGLAHASLVSQSEEAGAKFICTHCKIGSDKPGKCPLCKEEMKKAGAYACPTCDTTSDKPGKCACGKDYVKIAMAGKKCPGCGYYVSKEAKGCSVCKARQAEKAKAK